MCAGSVLTSRTQRPSGCCVAPGTRRCPCLGGFRKDSSTHLMNAHAFDGLAGAVQRSYLIGAELRQIVVRLHASVPVIDAIPSAFREMGTAFHEIRSGLHEMGTAFHVIRSALHEVRTAFPVIRSALHEMRTAFHELARRFAKSARDYTDSRCRMRHCRYGLADPHDR